MYSSFFFSSRRRHTRLQGDWSSDVCSSDLPVPPTNAPTGHYEKIFGRMVELVTGKSMKFGMLAAPLALWWMKGMPYPVMLKLWAERRTRTEKRKAAVAEAEGKKPPKMKTINQHID